MNAVWACVCLCFSWFTAACLAYDRAMFRTYFQCPECVEEECEVPLDCPGVLVKEPGLCGCCLTCARLEGHPCGVFTERCAPGLTCKPFSPRRVSTRSSGPSSWGNLLTGKGICEPKGMYAIVGAHRKPSN